MYIYVDESELDYLVIVAAVTRRPKELKNIMRRARQRRLPKQLRAHAEIKAQRATDKFKRYFYTNLAAFDEVKLFAIYLDKAHIPHHLMGKEGLVYVRMVISLLEACGLEDRHEIYVYADKRPLKKLSEAAFVAILEQHFGVSFLEQTRFEVHITDSQTDPGVQVADFVANALFAKYQHGNTQWYDIIKPLIVKELNAAEELKKKKALP